MSILERRIFQTWNELQSFLSDKGFIIQNNIIRWAGTPSSALCHWTYDANGTVNFVDSTGVTAFRHNLTDFINNKDCGCIFLPLAGDGFVLYLTPLDPSFDIVDLHFTCTNNYSEQEGTIVDGSNPLENGLVIGSPAEEDNNWRYLWRDKDPEGFYFDVDNTKGVVTKGSEIPHKQMIQAPLTVTLLKAYLEPGFWSEYIYTQVLGEVTPPGNVFKINGQKFISFTNNTTWRCPVFKLPPEPEELNPIDSTEQYSPKRIYRVGDYCINEGLLWRCTVPINTPEQFDYSHWDVTTVAQEKTRI